MGTRNLTIAIWKEEVKVAQFGQWDGYPEVSGCMLLEFLKEKFNVERIKEVFLKVRFQNEEDIRKRKEFLHSVGIKEKRMSMDDLREIEKEYPLHSSEIGAGIMEELLKHKDENEIVLFDSYEFASDSYWCEWAYVIDFDKNVFEVYKGSNLSALSETDRFFPLQDEQSKSYPVKLIRFYPFSQLPAPEEFLSHFD